MNPELNRTVVLKVRFLGNLKKKKKKILAFYIVKNHMMKAKGLWGGNNYMQLSKLTCC